MQDLLQYLTDDDPGVRRTAIASLTEHIPVGYEAALLDALSDNDSSVRRTAAEGLRELVEMLENPAAIRGYVGAPDPLVRSTALYVASARRVGDPVAYVVSLRDPDHRVRIEAVRALVSVDDAGSVATAPRTRIVKYGSPSPTDLPSCPPEAGRCRRWYMTVTRW